MYGTGRGIGGGTDFFAGARIIVPWIGSLDYVAGVKGKDGFSPAVSVDYAKELGRGGGVYGAVAKETSNNSAAGTLAGIGGGGTGDTAGTAPISFITGYANRTYAFI